MEDLLALKSMKSLTDGKPSYGGESRLLTRASSGVPEKSLIFGVLCGLELRGGMAVALNRYCDFFATSQFRRYGWNH